MARDNADHRGASDEDYRAFRAERGKTFGADLDEFRQGRDRTSQKGGSSDARRGAQSFDIQT